MNTLPEIEIIGRRMELTDAIRTKVDEVISKLVEHDAGISRIRIELEVESHSKTHREEFVAKGHLHDRRDHFDVTVKSDDLYLSIAKLGAKLDRFIRNRRRRILHKRRHPAPVELDAELPKVGPVGA